MVNEPKYKELKERAIENKIPILTDDGMDFITSFINSRNIQSILEIGTAVGYSSITMALKCKSIKITTIEKDKERYLEAIKNIKSFDLEDRITPIYNDALEVKLQNTYDLIFIDAAKSKNLEIFEHFEKNLNKKGYIITDNIGFHGLVKEEEKTLSRNLRGLVRKIKKYILFLKENTKYKTIFHDIGDGLSVSERRM